MAGVVCLFMNISFPVVNTFACNIKTLDLIGKFSFDLLGLDYNLLFIFRYLSMGNLGDANDIIDEVKEQMEAKNLEFPESDLIHFISFLLQT